MSVPVYMQVTVDWVTAIYDNIYLTISPYLW